MFVLEDEIHAEQQGEFATFEEAVTEVKRRAAIPWDQQPNVAPCESWKTCGREYVIVHYDTSAEPWKEIRRIPALNISAKEVQFKSEIQ